MKGIEKIVKDNAPRRRTSSGPRPLVERIEATERELYRVTGRLARLNERRVELIGKVATMRARVALGRKF